MLEGKSLFTRMKITSLAIRKEFSRYSSELSNHNILTSSLQLLFCRIGFLSFFLFSLLIQIESLNKAVNCDNKEKQVSFSLLRRLYGTFSWRMLIFIHLISVKITSIFKDDNPNLATNVKIKHDWHKLT